ncbi:hypothetical protein J3F84DRAFT_46204 [Trichoderma pleuroticola]
MMQQHDHDNETGNDASIAEEQESQDLGEREKTSLFLSSRALNDLAHVDVIEPDPKFQPKSNQATSSSSSGQKQSLPVQSTISDDRSQGSEFDRNGLILLALKRSAANSEFQGERIFDKTSEEIGSRHNSGNSNNKTLHNILIH